MSRNWNTPGIPHKGWVLAGVYDVREDGQPADETEYERCMMCNNPKIRFVHIVSHKESDEDLNVGCLCAEKMTNDYVNPKKQEKELKKKAKKLSDRLKKGWRLSGKGNPFLKIDGYRIVIFKDKRTNKFICKIDEIFGKRKFDSLEQAKVAAFKGIEYYKKKDER
jgi:hypothetical protein